MNEESKVLQCIRVWETRQNVAGVLLWTTQLVTCAMLLAFFCLPSSVSAWCLGLSLVLLVLTVMRLLYCANRIVELNTYLDTYTNWDSLA